MGAAASTVIDVPNRPPAALARPAFDREAAMIRLRARPAEVRRAERAQRTQSTGSSQTVRDVTPDRYRQRPEHTFGAGEGRNDMAQRDREIGRRAHALVASFCRANIAPEPTQVWVAAGRMFATTPMVLNHSSRQRTAGAARPPRSVHYRPPRTSLTAGVGSASSPFRALGSPLDRSSATTPPLT